MSAIVNAVSSRPLIESLVYVFLIICVAVFIVAIAYFALSHSTTESELDELEVFKEDREKSHFVFGVIGIIAGLSLFVSGVILGLNSWNGASTTVSPSLQPTDQTIDILLSTDPAPRVIICKTDVPGKMEECVTIAINSTNGADLDQVAIKQAKEYLKGKRVSVQSCKVDNVYLVSIRDSKEPEDLEQFQDCEIDLRKHQVNRILAYNAIMADDNVQPCKKAVEGAVSPAGTHRVYFAKHRQNSTLFDCPDVSNVGVDLRDILPLYKMIFQSNQPKLYWLKKGKDVYVGYYGPTIGYGCPTEPLTAYNDILVHYNVRYYSYDAGGKLLV